VAGERFSAWAGGILMNAAPGAIEAACEKLAQRKQFIRFAGLHETANGNEVAHYEFRHALYRQALYRRLSSPNRLRLHRSLGEGLMPFCDAGRRDLASEVALHLEEGRDFERAARYWMLTAENATSRFSHRDAIQILRRTLELIPELAPGAGVDLEIEIHQRIGDLQHTLGEMSESCASYQAAADRAAACGLSRAHVGALVRLSYPAWFLDTVRGDEVCRQALDLSGSVDDPLLAAQAQLTAASHRLLYDRWRQEDVEACAPAQETIRRLTGSNIIHDVYYIYVRALEGAREEADQLANALIDTTTNPISQVLAYGAKGVNSVLWGRFGEVVQMVRTGRELAERNGEDPWMYIFGDAWIRLLCFDFDGVERVSQIVVRNDIEQHAAWMRTVARISSGNAALLAGRYGEAVEYFSEVRNPQVTPKFFLHWHWRLHAQLGMTEAQLLSGRLADAYREAEAFVESAEAAAEPHMRSLAWEIKARVARAGNDSVAARKCIETALALVDKFEIPGAAWQVHRTAGDLSADEGDRESAGTHRSQAQKIVLSMADSFEPGEPLRESFLHAAPVRLAFERAASA
jgi:tetratricopeptide (TPR) repeat protein